MRLLVLPLLILSLLGWKSDPSNILVAQTSSKTFEVIKYNDVPYDGKRLYIGPIKVVPTSKGKKYTYAISNTGRRDLRLGDPTEDVVVFLDPTFNMHVSMIDLDNFITDVLAKKKFIKAGAVVLDESVVESQSQPLAESNKADSEEPKPKKPTKAEPSTLDLGNGTTLLESPEKEDSERGKFLDKDNCPDLIIKDIEILKVNKYMIAIEYTIKNQGTGKAFFHGEKKSPDDNAFIQAHLSPTPKFTRSALLKGENPIKNEVGNKEGSLDRTREFKGRMYLNVRGSTQLTPYLILNMDPYQTVRECNERNNRSYIRIDK